MSKDIFDIYIGKQLRNTQVPVPSGAWSAIHAQISPPSAGSSNFGFGLAAVVGAAMLIGLGSYSESRGPYKTNITSTTPDNRLFDPEVLLEADMSLIDDDESVRIPQVETTIFDDETVNSLETPVSEVGSSAESNTSPADQNGIQTVPLRTRSTTVSGHTAIAMVVKPETATEQFISSDQKASPESATKQPFAKISTSAKKGYAPFEVTFENTGYADTHLWDFGSLGKMEGNVVKQRFGNAGIYEVTLTAFNANGDSESKFVTIEVKEGSRLFMPSAVYPAGINKTYKVEGVNLKSFHLTVVNSTGKVIFETRNIDEAWEVDLAAIGDQSEIYIAVVRAEGEDGVIHNQSKSLTIIQ